MYAQRSFEREAHYSFGKRPRRSTTRSVQGNLHGLIAMSVWLESLSAPSAFHSAWKCHNLSTVFRAGVVNIPVKYPKERGRQSGCGLIRRRWELGCVTLYWPDRGRAVRGKLVVRSSGHCPFCHSPFFDIHITIVIRSGLAVMCFSLFCTTFRCKHIENSKEHLFVMT